jgi:hypothetical protein
MILKREPFAPDIKNIAMRGDQFVARGKVDV